MKKKSAVSSEQSADGGAATAVLYDSEANNRFPYTVTEDGQQYQTAHVFGPLSDERYLQWLREFKIKGNEKDVNEESREASVSLWNDVIVEVENIEEVENWKDAIPFKEKIGAVNDLLAVAVFEPETQGEGKRKLSAETTQTVLTEVYFNGRVSSQTHKLKAASMEWDKKYARIQGKRFKREITKGLRRPANVEFVPQDAKLGELYDEMLIAAEGFAGDVPLRFKTAVIQHIFEATLTPEEKK